MDKRKEKKINYFPSSMKKTLKELGAFLFDIVKLTLISLAIIIPIRTLIVQPFFVKGQSMTPTFYNGEYLIIDEISYRFNEPKRGEVIVFKNPQNTDQFYIKRIVGLPGEKVKSEDGQIKIENEKHPEGFILNEERYLNDSQTPGQFEHILGPNEYFVLGDNRNSSFDSRRFGAVERNKITGKVWLRAWPFKRARAFSHPEYSY